MVVGEASPTPKLGVVSPLGDQDEGGEEEEKGWVRWPCDTNRGSINSI
jgi:hypothetical protein